MALFRMMKMKWSGPLTLGRECDPLNRCSISRARVKFNVACVTHLTAVVVVQF